VRQVELRKNRAEGCGEIVNAGEALRVDGSGASDNRDTSVTHPRDGALVAGDHHRYEVRVGVLAAVVDDRGCRFTARLRLRAAGDVRAVEAGEHSPVCAAPFHHFPFARLHTDHVPVHCPGQRRS
jgi:hypothetical protein